MGILNIVNFQFQIVPDPNIPGQNRVVVQGGAHGLFSGGVVLDVTVGIDAISLQAFHQNPASPPPPPINVKALLDTGCTITSIDQSIAQRLNLAVRGVSQTGTANGVTTVQNHTVSLAFPGSALRGYPIQQVQSVNLTGQGIYEIKL